MDWVLSGLVVVVNFLIGKKVKWGWILAAINSIAWIYYAIWHLSPPQYGLVPAAAINFAIACGSFIKWHKESK